MAMENGALLVDIALSIRMMIPMVESMRYQVQSKSFALHLRLLKQLFDELRQCKFPLSETTLSALEALHLKLHDAKEVLARFSKESKIYAVLRSHQLPAQFHNIDQDIGGLLSSARLMSPWVSRQIQHLADRCIQEFSRSSYAVGSIDDQLRQEVENLLVEHRSGKKVSFDKLQKLAEYIGVSSREQVAGELAALEKARSEARAGKNKKEEDYIDQVISLFMQLAHDDFDAGEVKDIRQEVQIPADFRCPLSLELMYDPVIVASGQTYERAYIQHWLDQGNTKCPKTGQALAHTNLIPNYTVKALIMSWCHEKDVPLQKVETVKSTDWMRKIEEQAGTGEDADEEEEAGAAKKVQAAELAEEAAATERADSEEGAGQEQEGAGQEQECCSSHATAEGSIVYSGDMSVDTDGSSPDRKAASDGHNSSVERLVQGIQSADAGIRRSSAAELRMLTKHSPADRVRITEAGGVKHLVTLLSSEEAKVQEDAVTALLNMSLNDGNKAEIAGAGAIVPLINVLRSGGTDAAKQNAAAALYSLSVGRYKEEIGALGAVPPLVELLRTAGPSGKRDAATALHNLSLLGENRVRIVEAGAVTPLVELVREPRTGMVDRAMSVLSTISSVAEGKVAIGESGGIGPLVEVIEAGSARAKENAAAVLYNLCSSSRTFRRLALQEGAVPPLYLLSQTGTARAKEKAVGLLRLFKDHHQRRGSHV